MSSIVQNSRGHMNAIKSLTMKVDYTIESIIRRIVWSVVSINSYHVLGSLLFMMALSIDLSPQSAFLAWVERINPMVTPAVWKYTFLFCSMILWTTRANGLGWWLFLVTSPLLAVIYYLLRAIIAGYIPNEPFSYIVLGWLFCITTLFMLRTILFDTMLVEMGILRKQLKALQERLSKLEGGGDQ